MQYYESDENVEVQEWTSEMKEDWRARRDEYAAWQSRLDESKEEAIFMGELRKAAKELNVFLPDQYRIEVEYDEMDHIRVNVMGPQGSLIEQSHVSDSN